MLYAVGDGNHSLAAAKNMWEGIKRNTEDESEIMGHPARYALVELVNIHDEGLEFEPIHRVVFDTNMEKVQQYLQKSFGEDSVELNFYDSKEDMGKEYNNLKLIDNSHHVRIINNNNYGILTIYNPEKNLEVETLQDFLNEFSESEQSSEIDYLHDEEIVEDYCKKEENVGFLLPSMPKKELFKSVILDGPLPRKAFSMGEAEEKRYYLEARKIVK